MKKEVCVQIACRAAFVIFELHMRGEPGFPADPLGEEARACIETMEQAVAGGHSGAGEALAAANAALETRFGPDRGGQRIARGDSHRLVLKAGSGAGTAASKADAAALEAAEAAAAAAAAALLAEEEAATERRELAEKKKEKAKKKKEKAAELSTAAAAAVAEARDAATSGPDDRAADGKAAAGAGAEGASEAARERSSVALPSGTSLVVAVGAFPPELLRGTVAAAATVDEGAAAKREKARLKKQRQKANRHAACELPAAQGGSCGGGASGSCVALGNTLQRLPPPQPLPQAPAPDAARSGSVKISVDLLPDFLRRRQPASLASAAPPAAAAGPSDAAAVPSEAPVASAGLAAAGPRDLPLPWTATSSASGAVADATAAGLPAPVAAQEVPSLLRPGAAEAAALAASKAEMAQMRLQLERMRLKAEAAETEAALLREEREHLLCGVCLERERSVALVPCGHTYCSECVARLPAQTCPVCAQPIRGMQRLFGLGSTSL